MANSTLRASKALFDDALSEARRGAGLARREIYVPDFCIDLGRLQREQ